MLKIHDRLIFNTGIPVPSKDGLYIETGTMLCCTLVLDNTIHSFIVKYWLETGHVRRFLVSIMSRSVCVNRSFFNNRSINQTSNIILMGRFQYNFRTIAGLNHFYLRHNVHEITKSIYGKREPSLSILERESAGFGGEGIHILQKLLKKSRHYGFVGA